MKSKTLSSAIRALSLLSLAAGTCALAEDFRPAYFPEHFSGLINDYSPASVKSGPWEMHGQWTMDIRRERRAGELADFTADMTMSGYGKTAAGAVDATQFGQNPHTHHIKLTNVSVTPDMTNCPAYLPPATTSGFQINGTVSLITGNGSNAPFETTSPPISTLQVCVTGGDEVAHSNITLVFGGPATTHFGTQAIHGVVRKTSAH
jgi:hypothetical protein